MEVALVLLAVGFVVTLTMLIMGKRTATTAPATVSGGDAPRLRQLETELERKKKDLDDQRKQFAELNAELKQTKRKLFEEREGKKDTRDLAKARQEEERSAVQQLDAVRGELASAQAELDRLRAENTRKAQPRTEGAPGPVAFVPPAAPAMPALPTTPTAGASVAPAAAEPERARPQRVIRELSEADKEKIDSAVYEAKRARQKATELESELRRLKSKAETDKRMYAAAKGEADLLRDKFKALEKRTNRKMLENDLLRRAIKDLEKKTGIAAERTELTAEEAAASDHAVDERATQEAARDAERRAMEETARQRAEAEAAAAAAAAEAPVAVASTEAAPALGTGSESGSGDGASPGVTPPSTDGTERS